MPVSRTLVKYELPVKWERIASVWDTGEILIAGEMRIAGVWDTGEMQIAGIWDNGEMGNAGVRYTGESGKEVPVSRIQAK